MLRPQLQTSCNFNLRRKYGVAIATLLFDSRVNLKVLTIGPLVVKVRV
jgi:hypothetical protein